MHLVQENSWYNQEITTFTDSVYQVRHQAMGNLHRQIAEVGGTGVLAHETQLKIHEVRVERGANDEREDHMLEFITIGTIVSSQPMHEQPIVQTVLSLDRQ